MKNIEKLLKLADKIEKRMKKEAQMTSAQASDVEDALKTAGLWDLSTAVAPLLNSAAVPESAAVQINIVVDKTLRVSFVVSLNPPHASALALARLLKNAYAGKMSAALVAAKLNVADTLTVRWLSF